MSSSPAPPVPALQNGDHLTRQEFERRYEAMPDVKKAELVEGTVYMPSPVRNLGHAQPHAHLMTWLGVYAASTPGVAAADNATVRLDLDNEVQPDALLRIDEAAGGQSTISGDDHIEGAPELIAEVAHNSAAYDLYDKKQAYRRNGVQEYLVWQIEDRRVDGFVLDEGAYRPLSPDADGLLVSRAFPGLVLAVEALLDGDLASVLSVLQERLGKEDHQALTERLSA